MSLPSQPISNCYGYDRGTPVDRIYIEAFLDHHRHHIRGDGAEVKDETYLRRYGYRQLRSATVIDIHRSNSRADLLADLTRPGVLPVDTFDCIILTQVLHLLTDPATAITNCQNALRPEGSLLLTAPCLSRISPGNPTSDHWRFTPTGLQQLLQDWPGPVTVTGHGNLRTALAFLVGHAAQDLTRDDFHHDDPAYPIVTCAIAHRAPSGVPARPCEQ